MLSKDPERLEEIVKRWLNHSGLDIGWQKYKVFAAWKQTIEDEEDYKRHTSPLRFRSQILEITVNSSGSYYELANFHKKRLLEKLQALSTEIYIKDLRFIFGNFGKT